MTNVRMASTDPVQIPAKLPGGVGDLKYDRVFLVYIDSLNLMNLDIYFKCYKNIVDPVQAQSQVDEPFLGDMATNWTVMKSPEHPTTPLDLHIKANAGIIVFKVGNNIRFMEDVDANGNITKAVIMSANETDNRLYRPSWIGGIAGKRQAVSVLIDNHTSRPQQYGLGVIVTDSKSGLDLPIFIDPKVENDGNGYPIVT